MPPGMDQRLSQLDTCFGHLPALPEQISPTLLQFGRDRAGSAPGVREHL